MSTAVPTTRPQFPTGGDDRLLRRILRIDAWSTGAFGVVMLAGAEPLSGPLGLPTSWSVPFGVAMLGGAAALGLIAGRPRIPWRHGAAVVAGNLLSGVALLVLTATGLVPLTGAGVAFMAAGAVVVGVYAAIEFVGVRRLRGADARAAA
ncbi:hypothetical protein [Pseudonocardia kunmingensis]|uniref:Uncharacterized protein n=1 Tax=Pseudonocardia kunmingensis TaxID=630975 RepID=A0A543D3F3_9PSEU|nr:hypothetical protein [Pseudonocardia kunmingensis]TQM03867.1 hypothetical protein FB558_6892 [Pseudonocardia kunmingensis]